MHENAPLAPAWKQALAEAVRDPAELLRRLRLGPEHLDGARRASRLFPLLVPSSFLARIRPGDPTDPLLRQVLPLDVETADVEGFTPDPVGEAAATAAPGLLRKYRGRALLVASPACAVHCRYCFRRHFPYDDVPRSGDQWTAALREIELDPSVREVILSGGDPLVLPAVPLRRLLTSLDGIDHVRRVRVHTRMPIVVPERVDTELVDTLCGGRWTPIVVVHANHAAELQGDCAAALARLVDGGIPVLNQAVLLRGVNDDDDALAKLCERCVELRVLPYYLHQLDPVAGAAHFHVPEERGRQLLEALRARLPGYAVPRFVKELPGAAAKLPV